MNKNERATETTKEKNAFIKLTKQSLREKKQKKKLNYNNYSFWCASIKIV